MNHGKHKEKLLKDRAYFIQKYVKSQSEKGIPTAHSVRVLANRILFIGERTIYMDILKDIGKHKPDYNDQGSKF